jgi:hypothetical protein
MHALMAYIAAWNTMLWSPWLQLCPFLSPIFTLQHQYLHWFWTHLYTRSGFHIIWVKPILLFMLVRKLNIEWLMICIYQYHFICPK